MIFIPLLGQFNFHVHVEKTLHRAVEVCRRFGTHSKIPTFNIFKDFSKTGKSNVRILLVQIMFLIQNSEMFSIRQKTMICVYVQGRKEKLKRGGGEILNKMSQKRETEGPPPPLCSLCMYMFNV